MASFLDSKFPVHIPADEASFLSGDEFVAYITELLRGAGSTEGKNAGSALVLPLRPAELVPAEPTPAEPTPAEPTPTEPTHTEPAPTEPAPTEPAPTESAATSQEPVHKSTRSLSAPASVPARISFTDGLGLTYDPDNMMRTANNDLAFRTTKSPLVELFFDLEDSIADHNLKVRLAAAWNEDALATMKIIFNARSIHLGKSSRLVFYRSCGWLAQHHPATLIANLKWLVRPIIPKTSTSKEDVEEDAVLVELEPDGSTDDSTFMVERGASHGYWKDLLNLLALAANNELKVDGDPRSVLNVKAIRAKHRDWSSGKDRRNIQKAERHTKVIAKLKTDSVYRALHLTVARLFAWQLIDDKALLDSGKPGDVKKITLAAKWAPTAKEFHDKHTFIVSSIAELLHPRSEVCPNVAEDDRELYLKHAREAYRKLTISPLRKALALVERDLTAKTYTNIKYERVPSIAMNRYSKIFAVKDFERFDSYISSVAAGKRKISGATLLPSTLVSKIRQMSSEPKVRSSSKRSSASKPRLDESAIKNKLDDMEARVLDEQWKTLVQRIKDSGTLTSSLAVCDVSGSMGYPTFPDGTQPMDAAIGLSLLLAEVTAEPFGGSFITFSENPSVQKAGGPSDSRSFRDKVEQMASSDWSMNTDFVAVFERLILPMAIQNKLKPSDMVKQVFVFSDMQFDAAALPGETWRTSIERIKRAYADAGYEVPRLVFWDLAAGARGSGGAPKSKPVDSDEQGTVLVSGYSQAQLKMFLDNGDFEADEEVVEAVSDAEGEGDGEEGDEEIVKVTKKARIDPMSIVRKAISHRAYAMLQVVD